MFKRTITLVLVMLSVATIGLSAADDPFIGTWKLNVAKSHYSPGQLPKSATITYEPSGNGLKMTNRVVDAQGKQHIIEVTYSFDDKEHPFPESQTGAIMISRRINAYMSERVTMKAGKPLVTLRRVVSRDGRMLIVTQRGTDESGQVRNRFQVYDKQ